MTAIAEPRINALENQITALRVRADALRQKIEALTTKIQADITAQRAGGTFKPPGRAVTERDNLHAEATRLQDTINELVRERSIANHQARTYLTRIRALDEKIALIPWEAFVAFEAALPPMEDACSRAWALQPWAQMLQGGRRVVGEVRALTDEREALQRQLDALGLPLGE